MVTRQLAETEEKLRRWATLLSVCAPGATVLLVCSHADEVTDEATLQRRCERMFAVIQEELQRHRQAQEQELALANQEADYTEPDDSS